MGHMVRQGNHGNVNGNEKQIVGKDTEIGKEKRTEIGNESGVMTA